MTDKSVDQKPKLSDLLRQTADELDRLNPCGWEDAWFRTGAALRRGNPKWMDSGWSPIACMEAELARLYDLEKRIPELEQALRAQKSSNEELKRRVQAMAHGGDCK